VLRGEVVVAFDTKIARGQIGPNQFRAVPCMPNQDDRRVRYCGRWYRRQPVDQEGRDMKLIR